MVNQISGNSTYVQASQSSACKISDLQDQNLNDIFSFIAPSPTTYDGSRQLLSMVTVSKQFMRAAASIPSIEGISSYDHATAKSRLAHVHTELMVKVNVVKADVYNIAENQNMPVEVLAILAADPNVLVRMAI